MKIFNDVSNLKSKYLKQDFVATTNLAAVLLRVSTKRQKIEGNSLEVQNEAIHLYVKKNKLIIEIKGKPIAESAFRNSQRRHFHKMIEDVIKSQSTTRPIKHLVFNNISRASRNFLSTHELRDLVLKYGIVLHYVSEGIVLHEKSTSEDWERWERLNHESERETLRRRKEVLAGTFRQLEEGFFPGKGPWSSIRITYPDGVRGHGYEPIKGAYMKRAFEICAGGEGRLYEIKQQVDSEFLGQIDKAILPHQKRLGDLLKNTFYYGEPTYFGAKIKANSDYLPQLISKNLWLQAQKVLGGKARNTRGTKREIPYQGMLNCGGRLFDGAGNLTNEICGCSVSGEVKRQGHILWGCSRNRGNKCSHHSADFMNQYGLNRTTRTERLEEMFSEVIEKVDFSEEILKWFEGLIQESVLEESDFRLNKITHIRASIARQETKRQSAWRDKLNGLKNENEWKLIEKELQDEIKALLQDLKETEEKKCEAEWMKVAVFDALKNLSETFKIAPPQFKRKIISCFCEKLTLTLGQLNPVYKSHFNWLIKS